MSEDPYSRVYWRILDDPKFASIYDDDGALATWLRLLLLADQAHPAPGSLPKLCKSKHIAKLVDAKLVDLLPGMRFRIHGLAAERARRSVQPTAAALQRWSGRSADGMRAHSERGQVAMLDETRRDKTRQDELSNGCGREGAACSICGREDVFEDGSIRPHYRREQLPDAKWQEASCPGGRTRPNDIETEPQTDGLPHIDEETRSLLERLTGRTLLQSGQRQLTELDRLIEDHGSAAIQDALERIAAGSERPLTARQLVWPAMKLLEPMPSGKEVVQAEVERERSKTDDRIVEQMQRRRLEWYRQSGNWPPEWGRKPEEYDDLGQPVMPHG